MTSTELRKMIDELGLSQREAGRLLDIGERPMRRYCAGEPVPIVVAYAMLWLKAVQESAEYSD